MNHQGDFRLPQNPLAIILKKVYQLTLFWHM